jgi:3-oxoadipate enol-lactonase
VAVVLDALNIPKVHYIGLSIGGMLGQAFAIGHGHRLLSAMWCDTMPHSATDGQKVWGDRIAAVQQAGTLEAIADVTVERWLTDAVKTRDPGRYKQIRDTIAGTSVAGYVGCGQAIMNYDFTRDLPNLKLPVLTVCGADDVGTPPSANRQIAELVPGGRYEQIASARHFPNVEHPDRFNHIMLDWLKTR